MVRRSSTTGRPSGTLLDGAERASDEGAPGRALCRARGSDRHGSRDDEPRPGRRRDARRGHVPRQHRDEGLPEEPQGHATRPSPAAGSIPATSASCTRTATSSSRTAPRTSSSRAARTSPRSRSRTSLYKHPAVAAAAVVAKADEKWGETPCAFVELKPGKSRHRGRDHRMVPRAARPLQGADATSSSPKSRRPRPARSRSSSSAR